MKSEGPRKRDHETDEHVEDPDTDTGETQQEAPAGSAEGQHDRHQDRREERERRNPHKGEDGEDDR